MANLRCCSKLSPLTHYVIWMSTFVAVWVISGAILGTYYVEPKKPTKGLQAWQFNVILRLGDTGVSMTFFGTIMMLLFLYFTPKKSRTIFDVLIFCRTISEALISVAGFMGYAYRNQVACGFGSGLMTFSCLSSVMWLLLFSFILYQNLVNKISLKKLTLLKWYFVATGFVLPLGLAIPPMAIPTMSSYTGAWCFITDQGWRWMWLYIPIFMIMIINSVIYFIVYYTVKHQLKRTASDTGESDLQKKVNKISVRLLLYIFSFTLTWIWGLTYRFWNLIDPNPVYVWIGLHGFFAGASGFWSFLTYGVVFKLPKIIKRCRKRYGKSKPKDRKVETF